MQYVPFIMGAFSVAYNLPSGRRSKWSHTSKRYTAKYVLSSKRQTRPSTSSTHQKVQLPSTDLDIQGNWVMSFWKAVTKTGSLGSSGSQKHNLRRLPSNCSLSLALKTVPSASSRVHLMMSRRLFMEQG